MSRTAYTTEPVMDGETLTDVRIRIDEKTWHLWGRAGEKREADLVAEVPDDSLPVLIGSGLGHCLEALLERGLPVAVVDREAPILDLTKIKQRFSGHSDLLWIDETSPEEAYRHIADWQRTQGDRPLHPVVMPLYPRLDRDYYKAVAETVKAAGKTDFWSLARYPKFRSADPRVLFFDSSYFLCDEIRAALQRLGVKDRAISLDDRETGSGEFIESLLKAVVDFRPDFALTVNHFGLDREGKLAGLLDDLGLPLASWFVDNPHLILFDYAHPGTDNTVLFTFDAGNLDQLREKGFANVHYLPLATDPDRFRPGSTGKQEWAADISFVGNSMTKPVADSLLKAALPPEFRDDFENVARDFGASGETRVDCFLVRSHPGWAAMLAELPQRENRLALESLLTWEATRQYRLACVEQCLGFAPLIVGDPGWRDILPANGWTHHPPLDYYADLPRFYPLSKINFNCTSRQMPGAVNQRVFDVPACGGFVLTDYREQMEDLFDLDTEAAVYRKPEKIPGLIDRFLHDPKQRDAISRNARKRILAEHTYAHRLARMLDIMRRTFG